MINISSDFVTTLLDSVANILQQLWPVVAPILGIIIAFFIIRKIILMFGLVKRG